MKINRYKQKNNKQHRLLSFPLCVLMILTAVIGNGCGSGSTTTRQTLDTAASAGAESGSTGLSDTSLSNGSGKSEMSGQDRQGQEGTAESVVDTGSEETLEGADRQVAETLAGMTTEQKVAQLLFPTLDALTRVSGTQVAGDTTALRIAAYPVGGVMLGANNIVSPEQLTALTAGLQADSAEQTGVPLFISTDEEGGSVTRIAGNSAFPVQDVGSMASIGESGDTQDAYEAGAYIGSYLSSYGINMDFAPVADVLTNPDNTVIGSRSFGSNPERVADMAQACRDGLESHQVHACMKHFPGHGSTSEDSHSGKAVNSQSLEELQMGDLIPFEEGIASGTDCIMAGHISLPAVTGDDTPASLSREVITDLLRTQMGFDGVVVTDALNMAAVTSYYSAREAAVQAILAGDDLLLVADQLDVYYQSLLSAVKEGVISEERLDESVRRVLTLKNKWANENQ